MGVRNLYSIDVDKVTGKIAAAWVGPDQGTNSVTWGPAKTENAVHDQLGRQLRLAVLHGQPAGLPRQAARSTTGGGVAAPAGHLGTVPGNDPAAGMGGGGYWDCDDPQGIPNDSPFNNGLERIPPARATNIWYGPQGGCYDFPRNANNIPIYTGANNSAEPASYRRCPLAVRRRPGPDDRRHLPQAGG